MADTQLPLLGTIMCCTSIEPERRSALAAIASQMGAVHKFDLTSDVTHLIVGDTDTPKYKFVAKERPDVKCLLPSWIEAVRESWLEGGETDVDALELEHRLPTLYGLRVCVTGFEDLIYRKQLEDLINENGGEYRANLTKDITHLIAKEPSGAKYNYAGQWGIKTVSDEWLQQSLERGMILDESLYHLMLPATERGRNAWIRKSASTTSLGKRTRGDEVTSQNSRKLRRTASAKLSSHNDGIWGEINRAEINLGMSKADSWDDPQKASVKNADASVVPQPDKSGAPRNINENLPLKRSQSEVSLGSSLCKPFQQEAMFQGKTFLLCGFDETKTAILQQHLQSHSANVIEDASQLASAFGSGSSNSEYLLVPHTTSESDVPKMAANVHQPLVVTELWVERCIHQKRLEDHLASVTSTPFRHIPIAGFHDLTICSTGFQGIDLLHMSKAAKLMGSTYDEFFTPKASVLLCNTVTLGHEKLRHAQLWGVPAVTANWLWDCIRQSETLPFEIYLVQPIRDLHQASKKIKIPALNDSDRRTQRSEQRSSALESTTTKKSIKPPVTLAGVYKNTTSESSSSIKSHLKCDSQSGSRLNTYSLHNDDNKLQPTASPQDTTSSKIIMPNRSDTNKDDTHTLGPTSGPLQEITPNSSKKEQTPSPSKNAEPSASPQKTASPKPSRPPSPSLGPVISSLLAHHQRAAANPQLKSSSPQRAYGRRRRQLLGRAPSNLSSHSTNNTKTNNNNIIDLSRASSVDTMNTDGLGTPLEPSNTTTSESYNRAGIRGIFSAEQDDPERVEEPLQMTQLGYEDPDVAAWRERVDAKMGGGKAKGSGKAGTTPGKGRKEDASLGIAKRTRLATGR